VRLAYSSMQVTAVAPQSPAAQAGLQQGDIIIYEQDGVIAVSTDEFNAVLAENVGQPLPLLVSRNGVLLETAVVPAAPGTFSAGPLGASFTDLEERISQGFVESMTASLQSIWDYVTLFVRVPAMLINGEISPSEARPVSVVGISQIAGQMVETSATNSTLFPFLNITAFISVALGLTNLLPIPALDGGRILFVLIEAVRGRRIEPEREGMVHVAGMLFLLGLMVLMIVQDIVNPIIPLR
jgi:regulator of sigma E protease